MKRFLCSLLLLGLLLCLFPALTLSAMAAETEPSDNTALTAIYMEAAKEQHPSILFTKDDLPSLRNKTEDGMSKAAYTALETLANDYKSLNASPYTFRGRNISGRALQLHIATLAFYGHMKGKIDGKSYLEKAKDILLSAVEQADLEACYKDNEQLAIGDFATAFAIGYDWLYDYMTENEREKVKNRMFELGEWIYTASITETEPMVGGKTEHAYWAEDNPTRYAWNWNTVIHTGLTLISMATGEHPEWMARGLDRIEGYFKYAKNEAGMPHEGFSYTGYGMRIAIVIEATLVSHTDVSLVDRYEDVRDYLTYYTWAQLPKTGTGAINTNQSNSLGNISIPYYLANRYQSEEALWAIMAGNQLLDGGVGTLAQPWSGDSFDLPQLIVFENKALKPKEPATGGMIDFAGQEVLMRSGFSHKNSIEHSLASVRIGAKYTIWRHPDAGHVTFHAFDQSFLIDLGSGKREANQHNGIFYGTSYPKDTLRAALTEAREVAEGAYMVTVDLSNAYDSVLEADAVTRTVIYVNGNSPYIFIYDNLVTRQVLDATANWYTADTNQITETEAGLRIQGAGDAVCDAYLFDEKDRGSFSVGASGAFTSNIPKNRGFRIGHLFASAASADLAPTVESKYNEDGVLTLTVTYKDSEGKEQTDTIVASDSGVTYRSTARGPLEQSTDTERMTEATAEETTALITEDETGKETIETFHTEADSGSEPPKTTKAGCSSSVGTGVSILAAIVLCGVMITKNRYKSN